MGACAACGELNSDRARFCQRCGRPLSRGPDAGRSRRLVTVLFADVVGSTELAHQLDPEAVRSLMSAYFEAVRGVIRRHGGTIEKFIGDAVLAVFGVPTGHEDDPLRAVRAGCEIQEAIRALDERPAPGERPRIRVRVGIETGHVLAGDPDSDEPFVTGDVVNLAARLQQAAEPEETLVGPVAFRLVQDAVIAEERPDLDAKGFADTLRPHRVLRVLPGAPGHVRRLDTPMVNREREQAFLREAFRRTLSDRGCQLFTILGAAGTGKSRLIEEFLRWTGGRAIALRGRCPSYGEGIALRPVAEMLEQAAGLPPGQSSDALGRRLTSLLEGDERSGAIVERAMRAAGLAEGPTSPEESTWAIRTLLERLADRAPVVAVLDDVQWAKPRLLELLDHIAEWSRDAPIMLTCLARPELLEQRPTWGGGKLNATAIHLEPLKDDLTGLLVQNLVGAIELPDRVRSLIVEAAGGNPLFAEEIAEMLIEDRILVQEHDRWIVTTELSELSLPPTLSGLLGARLDHLSEEERAVLERAALVGREFSLEAVAALPPFRDEAGVLPQVSALIHKDLLRPGGPGERERLRFRHALIREAAYERISKEMRADLHERHADWLLDDSRHGEGREEVAAYHLERALRFRQEIAPDDPRNAELGRRAGRALASAGRLAFVRGDMPTTTALLERALALLPMNEPDRADLLADLAEGRMQAGDFEGTDAVHAEMLQIAQNAGDRGLEAYVRLRRAMARFLVEPRGIPLPDLRRTALRAAETLEELGDTRRLADALGGLATTSWLLGDARGMLEVSERSMHLARASESWRALPQSVYYIGRALVLGPTPCGEAVERLHSLLVEFADRPMVQASARLDLALLHAMLGHWEAASVNAAAARAVFRDLGQRRWLAAAGITSGIVAWLHGDPSGAEQEIRAAYDLFRSRGEREEAALTAQELAKVLYDLDRLDEANELIDAVLEVMAPDDVEPQIESRILRARILAATGAVGEAERLADDAERLAGGTDFLMLHGTVQLGRADVLARAGRIDEARAAAAEALERFERKQSKIWAERARRRLDGLA